MNDTRRTPFVGGNWKMNTNRASALGLITALGQEPQATGATTGATRGAAGVEVVVFPPFPYLLGVAEAARSIGLGLGAQDVYHQHDGAFTGEVSVAMLVDCGVSAVLVGHSERRHVIGEDDTTVNRKLLAVLEGGMTAVLCVGETLEQRESAQTDAVNERQLRLGLAGVDSPSLQRVVIAYEPVWAIGTGRTATPRDAQDAHLKIRGVLGLMFGVEAAQGVRIIYGGSMKPDNAAELMSMPDIDGGLIGGASLKAGDFAAIVRAAVPTCPQPAR